MHKKIPYGLANYTELLQKNCYFIDKTAYIKDLEQVNNPIFLRPRRFGKSLFCSMLGYYYNIKYTQQFDELFGHTWIGQNPTGQQNKYIVISLDFSSIEIGSNFQAIEQSFKHYCNTILQYLAAEYAPLLDGLAKIDIDAPVSNNLSQVLYYLKMHNLPPAYIIIDEYDNFANQLITANKDTLYHNLTKDDSFLKTFFKVIKEGRKVGSVANTFITGVLPITIDDLASAYNIGRFITLSPTFESMLGFTQAEVDDLLVTIYKDYQFDPSTLQTVKELLKSQYDGYHFVDTNGEALYNSTILMYFLAEFCEQRIIPKRLTDLNLKTSLSWVRRLTASDPKHTAEFVNQLTFHNTIPYDDVFLIEKFNMYQFFEKSYFPISFFYLGMLTRQDDFLLKLPNLNMRQIFIEYFNEIHNIDVSTRYAEMMQNFVNKPNLEALFGGYWQAYVSQLPEAIFQQMNENFYRTTFFELCRRYLSRWFIWHVERSYPEGKSDLEMVGKYNEKFAGLHWVMEFKYYSNSKFNKLKTPIEAFELQAEDTVQITGYVEGLKQEYPEAKISQFVIYCFGNQGFRVFSIN